MRRGVETAFCALAVGSMLLGGCAAQPQADPRTATAEMIATSDPDPWDAQPTVVRPALEGSFEDGTYTGTGQGMDGRITVTLSIEDGRLHVTQMTQEGETPSVGGYEAIRDGLYAQMIDTAQGSDIDTIAGATITTLGVREAVEDALDQARL